VRRAYTVLAGAGGDTLGAQLYPFDESLFGERGPAVKRPASGRRGIRYLVS